MNEYILEDNLKAKLIRKGCWLYDNNLPKDVRIYELNFDYYFESDKGYHDKNEKPNLNAEGLQYVITWNEADEFTFHADPSGGGLTLEEAIATAERIVQQEIKWIDDFHTKLIFHRLEYFFSIVNTQHKNFN